MKKKKRENRNIEMKKKRLDRNRKQLGDRNWKSYLYVWPYFCHCPVHMDLNWYFKPFPAIVFHFLFRNETHAKWITIQNGRGKSPRRKEENCRNHSQKKERKKNNFLASLISETEIHWKRQNEKPLGSSADVMLFRSVRL